MKQNLLPMKKIVMLFFVFVIAFSVMAQKNVNLAELNIDQLNLYVNKANNMSITGKILTIAGASTSAITLGLLISYMVKHGLFEPDQTEPNTYAILNLCGDAAMIVGIPLWIIGDNRKSKAEIALKKFNLKSDNSMALGLRLTVAF